MEPKYNTSFIPKKFLGGNVGGSAGGTQFVQRRHVMGPGYYLSVLIFVIALIVSGGVFAYVKITQQNIEKLQTALELSTQSINVNEVESYIRLNKRLTNANTIVNKHVAVSEVFALLEERTLRDIRYGALDYTMEGDGSAISMTVSGEAPDFQQVALQAKQFQSAELLKTPTVTNLAYGNDGEKGLVEFTIQVGIDPRLVSFGSALQRTSRNQPRTQASPTPTPTPTPEPTPAPTPTPEPTPTPSEPETTAETPMPPPPMAPPTP
jgi:hypothetical protein